MNIIYGLRDPRNDVYQYIGKSTVGTNRPLSHLTKSHSKRVNDWVKSLEENWLYPIIDIIEEVEDLDNLIEREKYWISYYLDINPELLNIQSTKNEIQNLRSEEDETNFKLLIDISFNLHKILRKERLYRKISQEEMAKKIGVNRSTLSFLENGGNVGLDIIKKYIVTLKGIDILTKNAKQRINKQKINY